MADISLRSANAGDTDEILNLLKRSLGEGAIPRQRSYWSWKHQHNPFGPSPALVAEGGGRIVGLRVFMRWNWGDKEVRSVRAVDTATHPDWRGQKIFSRLTLTLAEQMREEGVAFIFNTPNNLSRPGYLKMGWSKMGRVSLWVHPRRPWRAIRAMRNRRAAGGDDASAGVGGSPMVRELLQQRELEGFLEGARTNDSRLATHTTLTYLRWRYGDIPGFEYGAAWCWNRDLEGAVIIFRDSHRGDAHELRLCEIIVGPGPSSQRIARKLIRETCEVVRPDYAVAMAAWRTPEWRALLRARFLPAPRLGPILTVRTLARNSMGVDPVHRSSWRLSLGDLELF